MANAIFHLNFFRGKIYTVFVFYNYINVALCFHFRLWSRLTGHSFNDEKMDVCMDQGFAFVWKVHIPTLQLILHIFNLLETSTELKDNEYRVFLNKLLELFKSFLCPLVVYFWEKMHSEVTSLKSHFTSRPYESISFLITRLSYSGSIREKIHDANFPKILRYWYCLKQRNTNLIAN